MFETLSIPPEYHQHLVQDEVGLHNHPHNHNQCTSSPLPINQSINEKINFTPIRS